MKRLIVTAYAEDETEFPFYLEQAIAKLKGETPKETSFLYQVCVEDCADELLMEAEDE